ncbi:uncharacterized protein LOC113003453 [Solenopsis invicta]|uniref:uncharacterized protein LOC113003453 n=1 Tax=Solenopsis invicta TaxID=13686 RepID=UPI00193E90C7|nr:uncharacterized protein LOC113003453 [Solenopsis invicta]
MANIIVHSNFLFLVLDSSSGFKPGFLYGNNYWLGSRSQCLDISRSLSMSSRIILNNMQYRDLQKEFPPFDINYFVAHFRYNSTLQYHIRMFTEDVITLGFCLPASCSTSNLSFILERILQDKIILRYDLHFTDIHLIRVKNLKDDDKLSGGAFLYICIGLGLCFMTTTGTIYDIFIQKNLKKNNMNNINNVTTMSYSFLIEILLRFTPVYMMVLGLWYLSSKSFDKISQVYIHERAHETCSKYWWRNLLYIHNLFGFNAMCMNWSWYLSVDMQCYTINLMVLILSTIYFNGAVTILGALLISSIILTGYISYAYEYVPALNELYRHADILYIPPWMRINSYIIGVITGYILIKLNNNLLWKKKVIILCWCAFCLASACNVFILFLIYEQYISVSIIAVYLALQKMLYAMGVAWIVIACSTKHGACNMRKSFSLHWAELFWEDYLYLSDLRCVTSLGNLRVFQQLDDYSKICSKWYVVLTPVVKLRYTRLFRHHLIHVNAVHQNRCAICHEIMVMVGMAKSCQDCLERFDHADRTLLNAGHGIPVAISPRET